MKIKNVKVGEYIESKTTHGGSGMGDVFEVGKSYEVLELKKLSSGNVHPRVAVNPAFHLWVDEELFRKPKNVALTQDVFEGLDDKFQWAAVDADGRAYAYKANAFGLEAQYDFWVGYDCSLEIGSNYDASNWKNSLIKREAKELTGSDLCRAMLARGDKCVACRVSDLSDSIAEIREEFDVVIKHDANSDFFFKSTLVGFRSWKYAVPVNPRTGKPLTQKEVGL